MCSKSGSQNVRGQRRKAIDNHHAHQGKRLPLQPLHACMRRSPTATGAAAGTPGRSSLTTGSAAASAVCAQQVPHSLHPVPAPRTHQLRFSVPTRTLEQVFCGLCRLPFGKPNLTSRGELPFMAGGPPGAEEVGASTAAARLRCCRRSAWHCGVTACSLLGVMQGEVGASDCRRDFACEATAT